jgi:hypothetical protein
LDGHGNYKEAEDKLLVKIQMIVLQEMEGSLFLGHVQCIEASFGLYFMPPILEALEGTSSYGLW